MSSNLSILKPFPFNNAKLKVTHLNVAWIGWNFGYLHSQTCSNMKGGNECKKNSICH